MTLGAGGWKKPNGATGAAKNKESRAEYLRMLKIFSDLVLHYKLPGE